MFTGIITDVGTVLGIERRGDLRLTIGTAYRVEDVAIGASVACNGVCLTVVERGSGRFVADASAETVARTTVGEWREGTEVNLERSLRIGDELGGHLVYGHVDAVARVADRRPDGDSTRFTFEVPEEFARYIAPKGSVALDGVSLTVNEVSAARFGVNVIPHTRSHTTLGNMEPGRRVNLEVDMLARYVARLTGRE